MIGKSVKKIWIWDVIIWIVFYFGCDCEEGDIGRVYRKEVGEVVFGFEILLNFLLNEW